MGKTDELRIECDGRIWPPSSTCPDTKLEIIPDGRVLHSETGGGQVGRVINPCADCGKEAAIFEFCSACQLNHKGDVSYGQA